MFVLFGTNMSKKKFKVTEKDAEITSRFESTKVGDIQWEGEEVTAQSDTKIEQDTGTGEAVILRIFDFAANPETFKQHKPTGQELFNSHMRGIESLLWSDGLKPCDWIEPRLAFSKDKTHYRFFISCIPRNGEVLLDKTHTLSELLTAK